MTDREMVITHLDDLRLFADVTVHRVVSPDNWDVYSSLCDYIDQIKTEVEILLKEQEAKQVIKQTYHVMMNRDYENPVEVTRYDWLCPTCKSLLCRDIDVIDDNYHFCKVCGQAVKWND